MPKNCVQESTKACVDRDKGTTGNPTLQVGGEQEAVTVPEPAKGVEMAQDSRHPAGAVRTAGWDEVQVRGILLRTSWPLVLGKELKPIKSIRTAVTVCDVPLLMAKLI